VTFGLFTSFAISISFGAMGAKLHTSVVRIRFWSVAAISAAAYLQAVLACYGDAPPGRDVLTLGIGVLYSLGCVCGHAFCEQTRGAYRKIGYFAVQIPLGAVLVWLSPHAGPAAYFLLPLVSHAVFAWDLKIASALSALLFSVAAGNLFAREGGYVLLLYLPAYIGGFIFTGGLSHLLVREVASRAEAERMSASLELANAEVLKNASQAEALAVEKERNRLAREIHDGLGHYLTTIAIQSEAAQALIEKDPRRAARCLEKTRLLAQDALVDVRNSVRLLQSEATRVPLREQIDRLASADPSLLVNVNTRGAVRGVAMGVEHALFRTIQEGLTNVRKHSEAARADVTLDFTDPAVVRIEVLNDGSGADVADTRGFGLNGIRQRIEALGGRMRAEHRRTGEFCLTVEVPG
jgi:signal transduction histidine kinase